VLLDVSATSVLTGAAAFGLPGAAGLLAARELDDDEFDALLARAAREHVVGHLAAAADAGALPVAAAQHAALHELHLASLALDLELERLLVDTSVLFRHSGIEHRAIKGPALAHRIYPDPSRRSYADVDVLVRGAQFDDAVAVLAARGGRRRFTEPRPGFDGRFGKGVCVSMGHLEVDVHRTLVAGPFGLAVVVDDLFAAPATVVLGGERVPVLPLAPAFVHACIHAALGDRLPRLVPARDVAQLALSGRVDAGEVVDLARRWRCRAVVQRAIRLARHVLDLPSLGRIDDWAATYHPDRFERGALRAYLAGDRSYGLQAAAGLRALHGVRDRAAYARALVAPSSEYVRARDGGYLRRLQRGVRLTGRALR
jgi:hypothetical protein